MAKKPAAHPALPDAGQYRLKFVHLAKRDTSIILQNENGPCPLLAIANLLLVCGKLTVHADLAWITHAEVTSLVTDYLMANKPKLHTPEEVANYEQNVHDAVTLMPSLHRGLDVNVKFVGTDKFEFTQELLIFDLLGIQLRHGWVVDPDDKPAYRLLSKMSYNELMERLVQYHALVSGDQHTIKGIAEADRGRIMEEGAILQRWHDETSHQLTWTGLAELHRTLTEGLPVVFFRNNHFSTLVLKSGHLYCLTTDQGYLRQGRIVWERLTEIEGDVLYVDGEWVPYTPPKEGDLVSGATTSNASLPVVAAKPDTHDQYDKRALCVARDAALARQLQEEERHKAQQREDDWRRQEEARRLDKQRRRKEDDCAVM